QSYCFRRPGLQLSISQTKSVSTSLSGTFGASKGAISAEVGWNVTGSTSISISGSYKVPSTVNGKKVKSCKLNAHVVRKRKSFVVDKWPGILRNGRPREQDTLARRMEYLSKKCSHINR
ncbi:hypothetical protein, partial [Enterococcus diestrammenae]|uniref:hypothetical protein n=1 Tax=Enterococcus diestrammenae TaxID=1155073 RepID=UPI003D2FFDEC